MTEAKKKIMLAKPRGPPVAHHRSSNTQITFHSFFFKSLDLKKKAGGDANSSWASLSALLPHTSMQTDCAIFVSLCQFVSESGSLGNSRKYDPIAKT
jgi:hypothetical protein